MSPSRKASCSNLDQRPDVDAEEEDLDVDDDVAVLVLVGVDIDIDVVDFVIIFVHDFDNIVVLESVPLLELEDAAFSS